MLVGLRRPDDKPRAKQHYSVSIIFRRSIFLYHRETLRIVSNNNSFSNELLVDISKESPEGFLKLAAAFDPHDFDLK